MKRKQFTWSWLLIAAFISVVLFSTTAANAQMNSIHSLTANKYALQNLVNGIHSDNMGLKRSSIYFAGKYKIAEAEPELIDQLGIEKDASTRILIALVLYEMGSEDGLLEVQKLSKQDLDPKVRRMSTKIYYEYLVNDISKSGISGR